MTIYTTYLERLTDIEPENKSLKNIIDLIKNDTFKEQVNQIQQALTDKEQSELKLSLLPAFKPSVLTESIGLTDEAIATGLIQLEFDVKDNPELDIEPIKQKLIAIPEIVYCFLSPRQGLKFAVNSDFTNNDDENLVSLSNRFNQAYEICKAYLSEHIDIKFDDSLKSLAQSCYTSYDPDAYFNPDCKILKLNQDCVYKEYKPDFSISNTITVEEIIELLECIPRAKVDWDVKRNINFSVFASIGEAGYSLLRSHWIVDDEKALDRDLKNQFKSIQSGQVNNNIGTLINYAKEEGYKPKTGKARAKEKAKKSDYQFEPLLDTDKASKELEEIFETFLINKEDTFVNVSSGFGKSTTIMRLLKSFNSKHRFLYLIPTHKLGEELISEKYRKNKASYKTKGLRGIKHFKGKKFKDIENNKYLLCKNEKATGFSDENSVPIPANCYKSCPRYKVQGCKYIEQFSDVVANVRIMTHEQLFNEPSLWSYGQQYGDGSAPKTGNRKPDYIIIDEDFIDRNDIKIKVKKGIDLNSIRNVINDLQNGLSIPESILKHSDEIWFDYTNKEKILLPDINFNAKSGKRAKQEEEYTDAYNKKNKQKKEYEVLKVFINYLNSNDESVISCLNFNKKHKTLHYLRIKSIISKFKDVPKLFLDATANENVVKQVLGSEIKYHSIKVKSNDDIKIYQTENFTITKKWLTENDGKKIETLIKLVLKFKAEYKNVGFITYKNIKGHKDFDKYLSNETGIELYDHFGNIRGKDTFEKVDCLLILGRHQLPLDEIYYYANAIYGINLPKNDQNLIDTPIRMKSGETMTLKNYQYNDDHLNSVYDHFCRGETIQTPGRGRLIWGSPKKIFIFSKESLGGDIEISGFINKKNLFLKYEEQINELKKIGYCRKMPKPMKSIGITKSYYDKDIDTIEKEFKNNGIELKTFDIKDKYRKIRSHQYYIYDIEKFQTHIDDQGGKIV